MSNRVLVTGSNGFVGMALCRNLQRAGYLVRGVVRRDAYPCSRYISPNGADISKESSVNNIERVMVESIGQNTDWGSVLEDVDTVVHLAARVHVLHDTSLDSLAEFRKINTYGTERLAHMAAIASVRRFVYVSSIGVNGKNTQSSPFSEIDSPNPQDPYSISKWEAEQALCRISKNGMEVVIIRPPLVYGPGNPGNFMRLLRLVDSGFPLPLASINNRRSFINVRNLIDAIAICLKHPAAADKTYLVSDGEDVSTPELIRSIAFAMGRKPRLVSVPPSWLRLMGKLTGKSAEIDRLLDSLVIDSSKIRIELGWVPPFTLKEGLKETARWYNLLLQKRRDCYNHA